MNHTTQNRTHSSLLKFEKELLENGLLKVARLSQKEVEGLNLSLQDFIIKFFKDWNLTRGTNYVVPKSRQQTSSGRNRSSGDVFRICKYYYPNCRFKHVLKIMDNLTKIAPINSSICYLISKRVFYSRGGANYVYTNGKYINMPYTTGHVNDIYHTDEFGKIPGDYLKLR